jgi:hypothetical protein
MKSVWKTGWQARVQCSTELSRLAEGAGFEPAAHEVGAGFQDRWIKPLSHPSTNVFSRLEMLAEIFNSCVTILVTIYEA